MQRRRVTDARRSFTDEEKLAVVLESEQPGVSVAEVCRRHGIVTSMVFRWRVQFGFASKKTTKLASVAVADGSAGASSMPVVLHDLLQPPDGMTAVELSDGRRVFAPVDSDPEAVRRTCPTGRLHDDDRSSRRDPVLGRQRAVSVHQAARSRRVRVAADGGV